MNQNQLLKRLGLTFLTGALVLAGSSCTNNSGSSGGSSTQSGAGAQLVVDTISPVPIVNGNPANYSVYIKNIGKSDVKSLSFSIANNATSAVMIKSGAANKLTNKAVTPPTIDSSNCINIVAGSSCKINITEGGIGSLEVNGAIDGKTVVSFSTSTYPLTVTNSGDLSNALVLGNYPSTMVLQPNSSSPGSYYGSMSLSVVNQYNAPIDVTKLLGTLPTNVTWSPINCPNPLPFAGVCQVRLTYNGPMSSDVTVNLRPSGAIGSTLLPTQSSNGGVGVTDSKIASLNVSYPSLSLDGNNPTTSNSTTGYITNNGSNPANISGVNISNDPNGVFSISDNNCTGQLGANSRCQYTITADVSKLSGLTSGDYSKAITVAYNNGIATTQASGQLSYSYTAIIPPANLSIGITAPSVLNQTNLNGSVTVTNNSNVALTNLTSPTLSGVTAHVHVTLSDPNNCSTKTLAVGGSCSYTLTFNPQAPSETETVTISGISANYTDPVSGSVKQILFTNTASVNLNSQFAGVLELSGVSSLNATTTSGTITITNSGNYNATLGSIAITSSGTNNIQKTGGTCAVNQILAVNGTCTIIVGIQNTTVANSGASSVVVTYNNNNGTTNATGSSNIDWVIGAAPSLAVTFSSSTLSAVVNQVVDTTITLSNNGNNTLSGITLPVLTSLSTPMNTALSYQRATSNACNLVGQQLNNQTLAQGSSCEVVLKYAPTTAFPSQSIALGVFSAIHSSSNQNYTSSTYSLTLDATSASQLSFTANSNSITSLSPSLNWTNNSSYSQDIVVKNIGGSPITRLSISKTDDSNGTLSVSGCSGVLAVGAQCTLTVTGNYPTQTSTFTSNGSINFSYQDAGNSRSVTIPVTANVAMLPAVTAGLAISGTIPSTMYAGSADAQTILLTLTNNTTVTNNGNAAIQVSMDSLIQNIGTNLSGSLNTTGITSNACGATSGSITLNQGQSCVVNLVLTASGNSMTTTATIAPTYQYYSYTNTSATANLISATGLQLPTLSGSVTIQGRMVSLAISYWTDSSYTTQLTNLTAEQSITKVLKTAGTIQIKNTGTAAITGFTLPAGISDGTTSLTFGKFANTCGNSLAAGSICYIGVELNSSAVVSGNLSTYVLGYTYTNNLGAQSGSVTLPSLTYSTYAPTQPSLGITTSISGCGTGSTPSGAGPWTCNLNLGSSGVGSVGGHQLIVTYTNNSTTAAANNFLVTQPSSGAVLQNYYELSNSCRPATTLSANGGHCSVIYNLQSATVVGTINLSPSTSLGSYSYNYGIQNNGSSGIIQAINPTVIQVNIAQPSLRLSLSPSIIWGNSTATLTGTISNWYAASPAIPGSITINSSSTAIVATNATITCNAPIVSGCTGVVALTGLAAGTTNLSASIPSTQTPGGMIISATTSPSPLVLTVNLVTLFSCIADPITGNPCGCLQQNDGSGLIWYAQNTLSLGVNNVAGWTAYLNYSTNNFNNSSIGHCGFNSGWRVPTDRAISNYLYNMTNTDTSDMGRLGYFVAHNSISNYSGGNFATSWLVQHSPPVTPNAYSLGTGIQDDAYVISSPGGASWYFDMSGGFVDHGGDGLNLLVVRGGQ